MVIRCNAMNDLRAALARLASVSPRPRRGLSSRTSPYKDELATDWRGRPTGAASVRIVGSTVRGDDEDVLAAIAPALRALDKGDGAFTFWGSRCIDLIKGRRQADQDYDAAISSVWRAIATGPHDRHHPTMALLYALGPDEQILDDIAVERALEVIEGGCDDLGMHDNTPWLRLRGAGPSTEFLT